MKKWLALVLFLLCLPLSASAWEMEIEGNYITFPELENMRAYFRNVDQWLIVTRDNYEAHMDRLLRRGDTEEEIHARFAEESLLWEAYWDKLPEDACIRMERFETEHTRDVWSLWTLSTKERNDLVELIGKGGALEKYHTFSCKNIKGSNKRQYIRCGFTTWPPASHESGTMEIRYVNGQAWVVSYNVYERMAGRSGLRSGKENGMIDEDTPVGPDLKINPEEYLPEMVKLSFDDLFPLQTDLGELTVTGDITKGGKLRVTVDGEAVSCKVTSKGAFTVKLPLTEPGEHEIVFTATHSKYTDRVEACTIFASGNRTSLKMSEVPEALATAGWQTFAGQSEPGATITLCLDDEVIAEITADEQGHFSHREEIMDADVHILRVSACAPGKNENLLMLSFATEFESVKDGIKAFQKKLTEYSVGEMAKDPASFKGERVKISVVIKEITFTEEGLGILCTYNPPKGSKHAKTPLHLTIPGYGEDQLYTGMTTTIYGTVRGEKTLDDETRMEIFVEYGTYLVTK